MRNHLREAVEKVKIHYVEKLMDSGFFDDSNQDPFSLTLSELEYLYNKYC
ncbi:Fur-regulated basic protein FbpA [Bacillaceae bacterium S4-13-58]